MKSTGRSSRLIFCTQLSTFQIYFQTQPLEISKSFFDTKVFEPELYMALISSQCLDLSLISTVLKKGVQNGPSLLRTNFAIFCLFERLEKTTICFQRLWQPNNLDPHTHGVYQVARSCPYILIGFLWGIRSFRLLIRSPYPIKNRFKNLRPNPNLFYALVSCGTLCGH